MAQSREPLVIPRSWAEWTTTYGYVDNVASGIGRTVGNRSAMKRIFNIGEIDPVNHLEWAKRIANIMSWNGGIQVNSDPNTAFSRRLSSLNLAVPFNIDSRRIRKQLGFTEQVAVSDGLARTIADERKRG